MRPVTLNAAKAGMTRLREKGGASPESLYELQNGYVNASRMPTQRPGTKFIHTLPPNTKGLCPHKGKLHVFSASPVTMTNPLFVCNVLRHSDAGYSGKILKVHFAAPYLGYLYVVAEFEDNNIFHYWLSSPQGWLASHSYNPGDVVQPTTPNGYYYRASTDLTPPAWASDIKRATGDVIQPTVSTGWKYTCTATTGDNPRSGSMEPTWPQVDTATVTEWVEAPYIAPPPAAPETPTQDPNAGRYDNSGGAGGGGGSVGDNGPYWQGYNQR